MPENRPVGSHTEKQQHLDEDKALDVLCKRSVEIGKELLMRLEKLKVEDIEPKKKQRAVCNPESQTISQRRFKSAVLKYDSSEASERPKSKQFRKWQSFQKALEASWNKKDIEALAMTLQEFKSKIEFRILVSFRPVSFSPYQK